MGRKNDVRKIFLSVRKLRRLEGGNGWCSFFVPKQASGAQVLFVPPRITDCVYVRQHRRVAD